MKKMEASAGSNFRRRCIARFPTAPLFAQGENLECKIEKRFFVAQANCPSNVA